MVYGDAQMRRLDRVDALDLLLKDVSEEKLKGKTVLWTRGPATMLKLESEDERTNWERISDEILELTIIKPGIFHYHSRIRISPDKITVDSTLVNLTSWDWCGAYIYLCCGLDPLPAFTDHAGDRTVLFTADGPKYVNQLRRHTQPDFRTTAQYYEHQDNPMPRAEDGFALDQCGISSEKVSRGLVLRQAKKTQHVLAVSSSSYCGLFLDTGQANNCIHVNPSAGDIAAGQAAGLHGELLLLESSLDEAIEKIDSCLSQDR